jgi:hypothetical protein
MSQFHKHPRQKPRKPGNPPVESHARKASVHTNKDMAPGFFNPGCRQGTANALAYQQGQFGPGK